MLTALEAKRQTTANITNETNALMSTIEAKIKSAIDNKEFYCYIYDTIPTSSLSKIKEYFLDLGYQVKYTSDQRDGATLTIRWDE